MAIRRVLSTEDGNLQKSTLVSSRSVDYLDIDLTFNKRPAGDIYKKRDAAAVKQSIKNLLLTDYFEKPFQPFYGANLRALLFELADEDIEDEVEENIRNAIIRYEPRAEILNISVIALPDQNDISVTVHFKVISTQETVTFTTNLSRLR